MDTAKNMEGMSEALSAIHDEAMKLLKFDIPEEVREGLMLIISLARYEHDVRSDQEKESGSAPDTPAQKERRRIKTKPLDLSETGQ
jgi:hypothetical protein